MAKPGGGQKNSPVPRLCHGHSRPVVSVEYSQVTPDGYFLASASKDGQPMLRHGETGDWYGTFMGHKGAVWSCVMNTPALLCATGSADFTARVWDACTGNELHNFQHSHIVRTTAFASGSNKLATGGAEKFIRIFDLERPDAEAARLPVEPSGIRCLGWVQSDNILLCSTSDKPGISVFDTRTMDRVSSITTASPVTSIEISFDGQYMTTADGSTVRFFSTSDLRLLKEMTLKQGVESASYCPPRNLVVAGGEDMWVHLYDYRTGEELDTNKGHHGPVHNVRFAPTYDSYASGSEDGTIRIWYLDAPNGTNGA